MLIQFTVGNFKTYKEKATLSLVASNYDKETHVQENIINEEKFGLRILKSAVVYGANASGKSKLVDAIYFMQWFVLNSFRALQSGEPIKFEPFKLSTETEKKASFFEILFYNNKKFFRYGFEVTSSQVEAEWLFVREIKKEVMIFNRKDDKYEFHPNRFKIGNVLKTQELLRNNALILSSSAQSNNKLISDIIEWFRRLRIISGLSDIYKDTTISHLDHVPDKEIILNFLKAADMGIDDISKEKEDEIKKSEQPRKVFIGSKISRTKVITNHKKFDKNYDVVGYEPLSLNKDESSGTKQLFALSGPIFDAIYRSHTLVVDELDSKLHPNLVNEIAKMFNSQELNSRNAQLIFNTHNTNLLSSGIFRRDQIWFTEKNKYGAATLFSLSDIKQTRKNDNFEENYVKGKYGAIPYVGDFDELIKEHGKAGLQFHETE